MITITVGVAVGDAIASQTIRHQAMVTGLVAQTGQRTVCGMLAGAGRGGAGLATTWSHHRAHRFFSAARWGIDQIGLTAFDLVLTHLVADDAEV
ncbi:MAG TPA: hypothetical protein VFC19_11485, partial [Candidatus Limnocylindrales bacterium]|nr:hypothetical protein [Candidatus Limnocylindrales bacterium]